MIPVNSLPVIESIEHPIGSSIELERESAVEMHASTYPVATASFSE